MESRQNNNVFNAKLVDINDCAFKKVDGVYYLKKYKGNGTNIILLDNYNGESYGIGSKAFKNCKKLMSVTISNGVTSVGEYSFSGCKKLTSVTISSSITSIGTEAFDDCDNLENIYITDIVAWCNIDGLPNLMQHGKTSKNFT